MATAPIIATVLLAAPVVDIDYTLLVQGGIYLALVLVLNPLLFKPWLATQARRVEAIDGALEKSKQLRADADILGHEYDERLSDARSEALDLRSKSRREEEANQAKRIAEVRNTAATQLEEQRKVMAEQAEQAKQALQTRVDELASQITEKVLGRPS